MESVGQWEIKTHVLLSPPREGKKEDGIAFSQTGSGRHHEKLLTLLAKPHILIEVLNLQISHLISCHVKNRQVLCRPCNTASTGNVGASGCDWNSDGHKRFKEHGNQIAFTGKDARRREQMLVCFRRRDLTMFQLEHLSWSCTTPHGHKGGKMEHCVISVSWIICEVCLM